MRTRQRHSAHESTVAAVCNAKTGSWSNTARTLGFDENQGAMLSDVARGKPSAVTPEGENLLRRALGLPPINRVMALGCPTCGLVHGEGLDCKGTPVAAVVTLGPGEVVVKRTAKPQRERKADERATLHVPKDLARRINALRGKLTQAEYIYLLMDAIEED